MIQIDEIEFAETYRPILDADGSWRDFFWKDDPECLIAVETATAQRRVWTLTDIGGFTLVSAGRQFVNRLAYYITEVPWPEGEEVEVYDRGEYEEWVAALESDEANAD